MMIVKILWPYGSRFEALGKEAVDDECEDASVTLKSLVTMNVSIVRRKLKLGRACSWAVLLLKALDGHSNAGSESAV